MVGNGSRGDGGFGYASQAASFRVVMIMTPLAGAPTDSTDPINGANRGFRLRHMRQEAGLRQQRLALAPPHPPPLEPQHPDRSRCRVRDAQAPERLHLL